jgi:hypothetical protein
MVWIILAAAAVIVIALVALAWWSSGRAKPITNRRHRPMTEAEKDGYYRHNQTEGYFGGGSG